MEKEQAEGVSIQIKVEESTAQGNYANLFVSNFTHTEFVLDFAFVQPQAPIAKVFSRVLCGPVSAKRLYKLLGDAIVRYEAQHGKIDVPPQQLPTGRGNVH